MTDWIRFWKPTSFVYLEKGFTGKTEFAVVSHDNFETYDFIIDKEIGVIVRFPNLSIEEQLTHFKNKPNLHKRLKKEFEKADKIFEEYNKIALDKLKKSLSKFDKK